MGLDLETTATFGRAMFAALRDSGETEQLLIGEEISSIGRMRAVAQILRRSEEGRAILADRPRIDSTTVDFGALRSLPAHTLGRTYVDHLDRCGLDPDALTLPVTRGDELDNYLLERVRQTHDIWHAMLGLGAQGHEEVLVHTFQWPQLGMPYSALVIFFGTFKHLLGERRWNTLARQLPAAYQAGGAAQPLIAVYWERHWDASIDELRARLGVRPLHPLA